MPLSSLTDDHVKRIRAFIDDPDRNILYVRVAPESTLLAAKLVAAAEADPLSDELYFPHSSGFSSAASFYGDVAASVTASFADHAAELAVHGVTLHVDGIDSEYRAADDITPEITFADFGERVARSCSMVCSRVVFVLHAEGEARPGSFLSSTLELAAATGVARVKYIVMVDPATELPESTRASQRFNVLELWSAEELEREILAFMRTPARRVLLVKPWAIPRNGARDPLDAACKAVGAIERVRLRLPAESSARLHASARAALLEQASRRRLSVEPTQELSIEAQLSDICEQLARALLPERGILVVVIELSASRSEQSDQAAQFVLDLVTSACSPRVRYLLVGPATLQIFPPLTELPRRVTQMELHIAPDQISAALGESLADPKLSSVERIQYLGALASVDATVGQFDKALELHEQALRLCEETRDETRELVAWLGIGNTFYSTKRWSDATSAYTNALTLGLANEQREAVAHALTQLAHSQLCDENWVEAVECYRSAAGWYDRLGNEVASCFALTWLGEAQRRLGATADAVETWGRVRERYGKLEGPLSSAAAEGTAEVLERLARLLDEVGDSEASKRAREDLGERAHDGVHVPEQP